MDARLMAHVYRECGFIPFPLSTLSKEPESGTSLATIDRRAFQPNSNIGLFPGGENGLAVLDADNEASQMFVTQKLKDLGLYDWTTIVRTPKRGGLHFWLRVINRPSWVQTYYKLPPNVGSGEFRFHRAAYVLAPGSKIQEGEYTFVQGSAVRFLDQPELDYYDFGWALPQHAFFERYLDQEKIRQAMCDLGDKKPKFTNNPPILKMLGFLHSDYTKEVPKINSRTGYVKNEKYGSRSEAEQALVYGLVCAGWDYSQVLKLFDEEQPGHYSTVKDPDKYLETTYSKAVDLYLRVNTPSV